MSKGLKCTQIDFFSTPDPVAGFQAGGLLLMEGKEVRRRMEGERKGEEGTWPQIKFLAPPLQITEVE